MKLNKWRLHEACELNGYKVPDLANHLGVNRKTVYHWLRYDYPEQRAIDTAAILGVSVDDLVGVMVKLEPANIEETIERR